MEKITELFHRKVHIETKEEGTWQKMGRAILKGTLIAVGMSLVSLFLYAIVLANTEVQESTMPSVIMIVVAISLLAGAMIATRKMESKGILTGMGIGFVYMAGMYLLSSITLSHLEASTATVMMIAIGMLFAAIGGIIGVNLHK